MNQHEVVSKVAEVIEGGEGISAARHVFAEAIRSGHALISERDGEGFLSPVIAAMDGREPEFNDDGTVDISDVALASLPSEDRISVGGMPYVLHKGVGYRASVYPDGRAEVMARQLCAEEKDALYALKRNGEVHCADDDLYVTAPDDEINCPECGSSNVTQFYSDIDSVEFHCNNCDCDFEVAGVEVPSLEDQTFEDFDVVPEGGVHATYSTDGVVYSVSIFDAANEEICSGEFDSQEDADAFVAGFVAAYDSIVSGVTVVNLDNGNRMQIDAVNGDTVEASKMIASRSRLAARVACDGTMSILSQQLYANDVSEGDEWQSDTKIASVEEVDGDTVYYRDVDYDGPSQGVTLVDDIQGFLSKMDEGGYVQEL